MGAAPPPERAQHDGTSVTARNEAGLAAAEEARRLAMLAANTRALKALCAETLVYVHSSGATDSRESYLHKLNSGALRYEALAFVAPRYTLIGTTGLVHAGMRATVLRGGGRHAVASNTLAVWTFEEGRWTLQAVQASPLAAA
ncbi:MAG: hypothetical protein JWP29_2452 [Rhodoferax sp.]|nr:hypothetical protein [Rhodoferax sp.]